MPLQPDVRFAFAAHTIPSDGRDDLGEGLQL